MLQDLQQQAYEANMLISAYNLATLSWGNASAFDSDKGYLAIKPSNVPFAQLTPQNMVVIDLDGTRVTGKFSPSPDGTIHRFLYRAFPDLGGIAHTHSRWATVWAQAGKSIPVLGTTHADYFSGPVPCTRPMSMEETVKNYEENTGLLIAETMGETSSAIIPGVLVANHGPFTWGKDAITAVETAAVLEEIAMIAWHTLSLNPSATMSPHLLHRHFSRKHGVK